MKTDPLVTEGKAGLVKAFQDATAVFDSSGLCLFTSFAWTLPTSQPQLQAACEGDWSMDNLNLVGERIWNLEREFNLAAGFTTKDDNLPPRLDQGAGEDRPGQGARQRPRQDAAGVLRAARLVDGRRADRGDAASGSAFLPESRGDRRTAAYAAVARSPWYRVAAG